MILVKVHENGGVIAMCDSDLLGKHFEKDLLQLDVSELFYGGEEMDDKQIKNLVDNARSINIVGEESINYAIEKNLISKNQVITIDNVPHAQVFNV
jgi:hypothetical protein